MNTFLTSNASIPGGGLVGIKIKRFLKFQGVDGKIDRKSKQGVNFNKIDNTNSFLEKPDNNFLWKTWLLQR